MDTNTINISQETQILKALAQETRLSVFRTLVREGEEGLSAGDIAREFGTPHNTMSSHLSILEGAGLIYSNRLGRSIIYRIDPQRISGLLQFLIEDCCEGQSSACNDLLGTILPACGSSTNDSPTV